jgi:hypothetical protein
MTLPRNHIDPATLLLELDGYPYPLDYRWLRLNGFRGLAPWRCIDDIDEATTIRKEFLLEVGRGSIAVRDFLPFARAESADDYAGFTQSDGLVSGEVCVAHLTFRGSAEVSDYPRYAIYPSVWDWLARVLADLRDRCKPQAAADLEVSLTSEATRPQ